MADSKKILHTDIAEEGAVRDYLQKEFRLVQYLPTVEAAIDKTYKRLSDFSKGFKVENIEDVKKLNAAIAETNTVTELNAKVQKVKIELTNQQLAQAKIDKENKRDNITLLKSEIVEMDKTVGTLQRVEAANTRLRLERKQLNTETVVGTQRLKEINAEIDKNNKYITENSDKLKQQKLNVGNYTASIKEAFEGTGILGDAVNKYLGVITILSGKIESLVTAMGAQKVAEDGATAATEAASIAEKTNAASLEAQTVATDTATAATDGLGVSLKALAMNPYVIAAVAVAALAKVVYDNVTATQEQKDAWDANEEGLKAWAKAVDVAGVDAGKLREAIKELTYQEFARQDLDIKALIIKKTLRADAAKARSEATEENKTTIERINLLKVFVEKTQEAAKLQREELEKDVTIKQGIVDNYGKLATRQQRRDLQTAIGALQDLNKETYDEVRRSQRQITTLSKKYKTETTKLRQDADKEEIEQINTHGEDKITEIKNNLDKQLKLNKVERKNALEDLKKKQDELGAIDADGHDNTNEFRRERNDLNKKWNQKDLVDKQKADDDIFKEQISEFERMAAITRNHNEEIKKQGEKAWALVLAKNKEKESEELLAIEENYKKQKDHSVKAEEDKQKLILGIKLKYLELDKLNAGDDLAEAEKIQTAINNLKAEYAKATGKEDDKIDAEALKNAKKLQDELTKGLEEGLKTRSELQRQADQKDIDFHKRTIEVQAKLAAAGKGNTLAEEEARATKAEEKKLQDAKRAAKMQETITILKTFSDTLQKALEKGDNFGKAFGEAAGATGIVSAMFAKLFSGSAYEGTEDTGGAGSLDGKGGKAWILHPHERVMTAEQNAKLAGMTNDELVQNAMFANIYKPIFEAKNISPIQQKERTHDELLASRIERKFDSLQKTIAGKPVQNIDVKGLVEIIETIKYDGIIERTHHYPQRKGVRYR